tara:strand:- start:7071 stop:7250 length:180 start_codon:yes stop_codon:yes gene_type:complete
MNEEKLLETETNVFPIPSNKFTNPDIQDQLRTLYKTLEEFYVISHGYRKYTTIRVKNPE